MELIAYITLLVLITGLIIHIFLYEARSILHPSFWFFIIWIISLTSFIIFITLGLDYIIFYEDLLIELFLFIIFTVICFVFFSLLSFKSIKRNFIRWSPVFDYNLFRNVSFAIFIIAALNFVINSGFNLVENREAEILRSRAYELNRSISKMQILYNLIIGINRPLLILSGFIVCKEFAKNGFKLSLNRFYFFFPLMTGIIETLASGGRAGITETFLFFILGFNFGLFGMRTNVNLILRKIVVYGILLFVMFSLYSTSVTVLREQNQSHVPTGTETRWMNKPWLKPFAGILQYLTDHYPGYQLRRTDSITPELEMGQISLSGFTMFKIPVFSQLAGSPISIQSIFNLYEPNVAKAHLDRETGGFLWSGATATVYYPLYDDFGHRGTFIAIFVFVLVSQIIFNNVFKKPKVSFISILPLALIYFLWFNTIFSHTIIGNWMASYLYSFAIIDFIGWFNLKYLH
jgi:hypothetical protein